MQGMQNNGHVGFIHRWKNNAGHDRKEPILRLQDFKDLVATIGNKASYSEKELKNFLGY